MSQSPTMTEIRESEAPAEIASIYADIRAATALPQVNLIFRHIATRLEVLTWVWQTLRPLYLSRELVDAASTLSQSAPAAHAPSPIPAVLPTGAHDTCRLVIGAYNSGNAQNLIALTTFVDLLDGLEPDGASPLTPRTATAGNGDAATSPNVFAFPPIPRRGNLSPDITVWLDRLAAHHRAPPGVIPSLYVHLALWPEILPTVNAYLAPRLTAPAWREEVDTLVAIATTAARRLAPRLPQTPAPATADQDRAEMAETIRTFVNATIPEMVIVGRWLSWD